MMGLIIKTVIVVLFIGLVISLTSSFFFLMKDVQSDKKRSLYALGARLGIAAALMITIFYGLSSGYIGSHAPWDKKMSRDQLEQVKP
jgi:4-hydroxybenzoate polyprenyltransferase